MSAPTVVLCGTAADERREIAVDGNWRDVQLSAGLNAPLPFDDDAAVERRPG